MKAVLKYGLFVIALLGFIVGEMGFGVSMLLIAIVYTIITSR
jgi:hypothetical protein